MRAFWGQQDEEASPHSARARSRSGGLLAITSHPIFKPALMGWAGALVALIILVLPVSLIERLTVLAGLEFVGDFARYIFAIIGGVVGAGIGLVLALALKGELPRRRSEWSDDDGEGEYDAGGEAHYEIEPDGDIHPIDPTTELGSESLDAPIETAEFEEIVEPADAAPLAQAEDNEVSAEPHASETGDPEISETDAPQGRRRGLAQLVRDEEAISDPDDAFPNYGQDEMAVPEDNTELTDCSQADDDEGPLGTCEASDTFEKADDSGQDDPEEEVALPDAESAQTALDALDALIQSSAQDESSVLDSVPAAMGLEEFAALPGRDAVWVEDTGLSADSKPAQNDPSISPALGKLRATPLEELSLVQMIERFAAALEDRKAARADAPPDRRDQQLAETLKSVTAPTEPDSPDTQLDEEDAKLRDALDKLADLRGAA